MSFVIQSYPFTPKSPKGDHFLKISSRIGNQLVPQNWLSNIEAYFNWKQDSIGIIHLQEIG